MCHYKDNKNVWKSNVTLWRNPLSIGMLSVQSPGYAGMGQRLGTPGGPGGGGGTDRPCPCHDLNNLYHERVNRDYNQFVEFQMRTRSIHHSEALNCPPQIALPDGERGKDKYLELRVDYQKAELTQAAIRPPPNKSVQDLPDWSPTPSAVAPRKPPSPNKKDGFVQKVKYIVSKTFNGGKGTETVPPVVEPGVPVAGTIEGLGVTEPNHRTPCVMVPRPRPPPAPVPPVSISTPPPPMPPAPPPPPHAPPS